MKLRKDDEADVLLIEPDDPEDLIPIDAEAAEDLADALSTLHKYQALGPTAFKTRSETVADRGGYSAFDLIPRRKRGIGI